MYLKKIREEELSKLCTSRQDIYKKGRYKIKTKDKKTIDELKILPPIEDVKPMQTIEMIEMLPDEEISIIHALVSKIIKA